MPAPWLRMLVFVVALGGTLAAQAHFSERTPSDAAGEALVPRPELARIAALGFDSLASDYFWLRAVQLVGGAHADPSRHAPELARLVEVATALDPFVDHPYRFAALWLTDSPESVRQANRILERGVAYHPAEWRNRFHLAFNHFFYLGDSEAAARELERAVTLPGAPRYLGRLLARLRSESGGLEVAAVFLEELLAQTDDGYLRAEYEKALDEIETERRARLLDRARDHYRERHGRDIERVEDLVEGRGAVLAALPPEPHGWEWVLDAQSGEIVSSYLRRRYELHVHPNDRARREAWAREAGGGS